MKPGGNSNRERAFCEFEIRKCKAKECQAMNPSPSSNSPAAERPKTCRAKWAPPAWLHKVAPDDDRFMAELIDVFRAATEASLQQMRTALATVDVPRLRSEAHRTKDSARQVGADALAELCQAPE